MNFAIARLRKLKSMPALLSVLRHNLRQASTLHTHADFGVQVLSGPSDVLLAAQDLEDRLPKKRRRNAVLAVEVLLTASPAYFRPDSAAEGGTWSQQRLDAWLSRAIGFLQREYGDTIVSIVLHLDEQTPHVHALIIPILNGKLNAKNLIGGPVGLRAWQDRIAECMKDLGQIRGVRGSRATHERISRFYGQVNSMSANAVLPTAASPLPPDLDDPSKISDLKREADSLQAKLREALDLATQHAEYLDKAASSGQAKRAAVAALRRHVSQTALITQDALSLANSTVQAAMIFKERWLESASQIKVSTDRFSDLQSQLARERSARISAEDAVKKLQRIFHEHKGQKDEFGMR